MDNSINSINNGINNRYSATNGYNYNGTNMGTDMVYRTKNIPKSPRTLRSIENYAPTFNNYYQKPEYDPPTELWFEQYLNCLHVLAQTYDNKTIQNQKAMKCFIVSLADIVPNQETKTIMNDFINMSDNVRNILFNSKSLSVTSFFKVNNQVPTIINASPDTFLDYCLANSEVLFMWTYLLHCYYDILSKKEPEPFNSLKTRYLKEIITKATWGNLVWYVMHYTTYHAPNIIDDEWKDSFIAFMSCLQNVLPCSICRNHIKENLPKNNIKTYIRDKHLLFEWTWKLHNIVNSSLDKPILSLEEAKRLYDPFIQPWITQNSNMTKY
jgi:hypothetical protein